jgi:hypothetical protein
MAPDTPLSFMRAKPFLKTLFLFLLLTCSRVDPSFGNCSFPLLPHGAPQRSNMQMTGAIAQRVVRTLEKNLNRKCNLLFESIDEPEIKVIAVKDGARSIASQDYDIEDGVLTTGFTYVTPSYRDAGVSTLMLERIVTAYPEITAIRADALTRTNIYEIEDAVRDGAKLPEAIRKTPAYKIRAQLGFTEIVPGSIDPDNFAFTVRKPQN